jgi:hypothetical protein
MLTSMECTFMALRHEEPDRQRRPHTMKRSPSVIGNLSALVIVVYCIVIANFNMPVDKKRRLRYILA